MNTSIDKWNGQDIRFVEKDGEVWAVAQDVCEALDIAEAKSSMRDFPENEKGVHSMHTLTASQDGRGGGRQKMLIVNEIGMYRLIFQSRKPEAEAFKTWVFQVIKELRKSLGKTTYLNEEQATAVKLRIAGHQTARERNMVVLEAMKILQEDNETLYEVIQGTEPELAKLRVENAELRSKALTAGLITDEGGGVSMKALAAVIGNPQLGPKALSFRLKLDLFIDGRNRPFRQTVDEGLMYRTKHGRLLITEKGAAYFKELYKDYDPITWRRKVRGKSII
jgi:prophage antirepressor-like protein